MLTVLKKMNGSIHSVGAAALIIAVAGIASRLVGFLRDRILAAQFGAGDTLDVYYAAFRIPDFLYGFLVLGALSAAFVPLFTELYAGKKEQEAWNLSSGVLNLLVSALVLLSALVAVFSPWLTDILVPGFSPEKKVFTSELTRIMLLSPIFLGMSAVFGGVLVSLKRFFLYSLAPVFYNAGIIAGAIFFAPRFGVSGLAWGVVLGAALHACVQYIDLRQTGFVYRWPQKGFWKNEMIRRVLRLMIPRSLGVAVNQVGFFVVTVFASWLVSGSLAVFTLANNIQSVPLGLFGVAFSLAVFPTLATLATTQSHVEFFRTFAKTFQRILFFVVPVSVLMIVLRAQIVRVILGSGQFDWNDTILTFNVLGILSLSLFAQSLIPLLARAFFALQDTKTPLYIALVSEVIHILLTLVLIRPFGIEGIAWAFSLATLVNFFLLYRFLRKRLDIWEDHRLISPAFKIIIASLGAGLVGQLTKMLFGFQEQPLDTFVAILIQLVITSLFGGAAFLLLGWAMRIEQLEPLKRFLFRRVLGQPQVIVESEKEVE